MKEDKTTIGYYDETSKQFVKELGGQGEFYKNFESFENKTNDICYIPELSNKEYIYSDFWEIAKGNINLAKILFETVDWQTPETVFTELVNSGEIDRNGKFLIWLEGNLQSE